MIAPVGAAQIVGNAYDVFNTGVTRVNAPLGTLLSLRATTEHCWWNADPDVSVYCSAAAEATSGDPDDEVDDGLIYEGVAIARGDGKLRIPIRCRADAGAPLLFAGTAKTRASTDNGDPVYQTIGACTQAFAVGQVPDTGWIWTEYESTFQAFADCSYVGPVSASASVQARFLNQAGQPIRAARSEWILNALGLAGCGLVTDQARLVDVDGLDEVLALSAGGTNYEFGDISGNDLLFVDGSLVSVTDSVPIAAGALTIMREPDTEVGPPAKIWTIENEDPFLAEVSVVDGSYHIDFGLFEE